MWEQHREAMNKGISDADACKNHWRPKGILYINKKKPDPYIVRPANKRLAVR